jgi:hypothetical protein
MFVKIAAQVLLGAGAVFDATLISREQLAALAGLGVGLPDFDGEAAEIDPRDLGRVDFVVGQIAFPDLPGTVALEDEHLAAEGREAFGDGEAIRAGFEDENVFGGGVPRGPRAEGFQGLARDAVEDARAQRIAPLEDGGGEGVRVDVEADGAASRAGNAIGSGRLLW